jgi:glyceraldehyde 3-phosphate dehydrogenase
MKKVKVAISGFGRIGRNILRALYESDKLADIEIVAINDVGSLETNALLMQYDSTHGRFPGEVKIEGDQLSINGQLIPFFKERNPAQVPWSSVDVDVVLECSGFFTNAEKARGHLEGGAKKVLISAPASGNVDATIVYGVNHQTLKASDTIVSNASCTTNCLAPVAKVLHEAVGIEKGFMTTVHSYTSDQKLVDSNHEDIRRARAAAVSLIPTKTGAAQAVGLVLPELSGKLDGVAVRVPTPNVSLVDLTVVTSRNTSVQEVNELMIAAAAQGPLRGVLAVNELPLVSIDFNHNPHSSIFDLTETKVKDNLVSIFSWYDNEWGFSNRMLDTAIAMMRAK